MTQIIKEMLFNLQYTKMCIRHANGKRTFLMVIGMFGSPKCDVNQWRIQDFRKGGARFFFFFFCFSTGKGGEIILPKKNNKEKNHSRVFNSASIYQYIPLEMPERGGFGGPPPEKF